MNFLKTQSLTGLFPFNFYWPLNLPIHTTPNVPPPPDPSLNFLDILLPKNKGKNAVAKKDQQKVQKN